MYLHGTVDMVITAVLTQCVPITMATLPPHTHTHTQMRRLLHHHFQGSVVTKRVYDVITTTTTVTINLYAAHCFPLLSAENGLKYWRCVHLVFIMWHHVTSPDPPFLCSYFYYVPLIVVVLITVLPLPGSGDRKGKLAHNVGVATKKAETEWPILTLFSHALCCSVLAPT